MRKEKEYLIDRLKKAGVKGNVFTSLKKMEMSRNISSYNYCTASTLIV